MKVSPALVLGLLLVASPVRADEPTLGSKRVDLIDLLTDLNSENASTKFNEAFLFCKFNYYARCYDDISAVAVHETLEQLNKNPGMNLRDNRIWNSFLDTLAKYIKK